METLGNVKFCKGLIKKKGKFKINILKFDYRKTKLRRSSDFSI